MKILIVEDIPICSTTYFPILVIINRIPLHNRTTWSIFLNNITITQIINFNLWFKRPEQLIVFKNLGVYISSTLCKSEYANINFFIIKIWIHTPSVPYPSRIIRKNKKITLIKKTKTWEFEIWFCGFFFYISCMGRCKSKFDLLLFIEKKN
jgi:hypothetical protein